MIELRIIYITNIVVAGWIGIISIFSPRKAAETIFTNAYNPTEVMKLVGCLWLGIALVSLAGVWKPFLFSSILLLQFIYKCCWLLLVAIPSIKNHRPYPKAMALFFIIWVVLLPLVIPFGYWVSK